MKNQLNKQWIVSDDSDIDRRILERHFNKHYMTPKRLSIIQQYAIAFTTDIDNSAPYGFSPNGFRYRCGCEHDCCGCLSSAYADLYYTPTDVIVRVTYIFNY